MNAYESSIIIPVYNNWELTRTCLKSLAATLDKSKVQVIVVDNASTDVTSKGCPFLGEALFGEGFKYLRNETNRNFAGASNDGADAAAGEFLIFLNNDTKALPGWYEPLLADFSVYSDLAATGPLLLYPDETPFGRLAQHLGVLVSPFMRFGHLYQGIPAASPLAKERRFFQAITAACMVIKKALFLETGKFDENYVNGFEDVDLCGRLLATGRRFTVNPESVVLHYESKSEGRNKKEEENFARLWHTTAKYFKPDWEKLIRPDNLRLSVNEWLHLQPTLETPLLKELNAGLANFSREELKNTLFDLVYWEDGWRRYLELTDDPSEWRETFKIFFKFFKNPPNAALAVTMGRKSRDKELTLLGSRALRFFRATPETYLKNARYAVEKCREEGLEDLAALYQVKVDDYDNFIKTVYPLYERDYFGLLEK